MKQQALLIALVFGCVANGITAVEVTQEALVDVLQKSPSVFEKVDIKEGGQPTAFCITLGTTTAKIGDAFVLDGFRFTVPKSAEGLDFVWYFNAPAGWGTWYICPVKGDARGGFQGWLDADKVYETVDVAGEQQRLRVLQTLASDYFRPGDEYILWFNKVDKEGGNSLRGRLCFVSRNAGWDYDNIEKALALKPMAPDQQVRNLGSRGGAILLDKEFFDREYAAQRIDNVFFSLRQTKRMRGGFFVTMEIACPPCRTEPPYARIRGKYGEADFVQSAKEEKMVRLHAGGDVDKDTDDSISTYYYDYFGFEVAQDDKNGKVLRVVTHANDYAKLRPKDSGAYFEQIGLKNLTVLHKANKEVGRLYYFLEGGKTPLCTLEPPVGIYKRGPEQLEYQGEGKWLWRTLYEDGSVARRIPLVHHRLEGTAEGYFPGGKLQFRASYKEGVLHGEVIEYSDVGDVVSRREYRNGQPQDKAANTEKGAQGDDAQHTAP